MRVHELAKKLGIQSKEVLATLNDLGVEVKSVHSAVADEDAARVEASLPSSKVAKKTTKKVAKKTTKKKLGAQKKVSKKAPKATVVAETIPDPPAEEIKPPVLESKEDGQNFVNEKSIDFAVGPDTTGKVSVDYQISVYPTTIFVDSKGNIADYWQGEINAEELKQKLTDIQKSED